MYRAMLYVPADRDRMLHKCATLKPDSFIFDLEDAVAAADKKEARQRLAAFLSKNQIGPGIGTWIRVNSADEVPDVEEIRVAVGAHLTGVVIPKASPLSLANADELLTKAEKEWGDTGERLKIMALVETPMGIETIDGIIKSTNRVAAVQFGAEDFTLEMGVPRSREGLEILYPRQRMAIACRAYGVEAVDTPYTDYADEEGLVKDAELVRSLGFTGKTLIHPGQIDPVRRVFTPSEREIERARKIIEIYEREGGEGSFALDGAMIDRPIIMRAKALLDLAGCLRQ